MSFVHLHTHSHYSLLDGVPKIPELVKAAKNMKMPALALTDHGNLYGAIEFYQEAKKIGIKPIIGVEAYVAPNGINVRKAKERPYHLTLLAENNQGYENLIELITTAHLHGFYSKPRIDLELLKKHSDGLIALSGSLSGEIPRTIINQGYDEAVNAAKKYLEIFDEDHFYLEVQHMNNAPEQDRVQQALKKMQVELGLKFVATNDVHYIDRVDSEAQDVLVCIQTKRLLTDENRLSMTDEDYSLKPADEMAEIFRDFPDAITNTVKIADRVNVDLEFGTIQMPYYDLPENITPEQELRKLCEAGLERRYDVVTNEVKKRLDYELDIIVKTGFSSYFLIVQDFINWAKGKNIAVGPGRGSAAGSLVSYLTNIADIDPIKYSLLFERFLNPERVSQPDIDTDFADIRRDDVLQYVEEKYGKDHVAQIITFGTMAARAAIRDVG
ncbi:MAG: DNA polymerase III subunit alpha, partial [Candidatus Thermoplasmatota archaeon]|nr:DNA polymerase III subunit alpha [Candidatus Thermoplasmatota archaeon]